MNINTYLKNDIDSCVGLYPKTYNKTKFAKVDGGYCNLTIDGADKPASALVATVMFKK